MTHDTRLYVGHASLNATIAPPAQTYRLMDKEKLMGSEKDHPFVHVLPALFETSSISRTRKQCNSVTGHSVTGLVQRGSQGSQEVPGFG